MRPLRIAVIGGAQYDQVHAVLESFTLATGVAVEVAFRGEHVLLNRHLSSLLAAGGTYDLISTHSKYVPSQARWLQPLDDLVPADLRGAMQQSTLELCSVDGELMCMPRNIDARLLFVNRDLIDDHWVPSSWPHLLESAVDVTARTGRAGYAFPTRDSGLFGTFYELTAAFGGHLFDESGGPQFTSPEAVCALEWLIDACRIRSVTPPGLVDDAWYFDEVSDAFRAGSIAIIGDWPGYYALLAAQPAMRERVRVIRYPAGSDGRRYVYSGCHGWAIPSSARDRGASIALLSHLTSREAATVDAAAGMVPVRFDVSMPADHALAVERAELLRLTVASDLLTFPPLAHYPQIEDAAAASLRSALLGECAAPAALAAAQQRAGR